MAGAGLFLREYESGGVLYGTTPADARRALAGLIAPDATLDARPGVLEGAVVSGTSSTSPWRYSVAPGRVVTARAAGDGVVLSAWASAELVETSAAPGSGSRTDVVWVRHRDVDAGDAGNELLFGCTSGAVGGGVPAIPAGAIELRRYTVSSGMASTSAATASDVGVQYTAPRGAPIPVTSQAQRDALAVLASQARPIEVDRRDTGRRERSVGAGWREVLAVESGTYTPTVSGWVLGTGGSASGRYVRRGDWVDLQLQVRVGGSDRVISGGGLQVSPPPGLAPVTGQRQYGSGLLFDNAPGVRYPLLIEAASGGDLIPLWPNPATGRAVALNSTTPTDLTYAENDLVYASITYRVA